MRPILSALTAATLAMTLAVGVAAPADAATIYMNTPGSHANQGMFEQHGDYAYYNNQRGTRHRTSGYRYYQGYWFPPAAFLGLFLGTILLNGAQQSSHTQWCYAHYKSYRASDNSFQPYSGPRQQCVSPYLY